MLNYVDDVGHLYSMFDAQLAMIRNGDRAMRYSNNEVEHMIRVAKMDHRKKLDMYFMKLNDQEQVECYLAFDQYITDMRDYSYLNSRYSEAKYVLRKHFTPNTEIIMSIMK